MNLKLKLKVIWKVLTADRFVCSFAFIKETEDKVTTKINGHVLNCDSEFFYAAHEQVEDFIREDFKRQQAECEIDYQIKEALSK